MKIPAIAALIVLIGGAATAEPRPSTTACERGQMERRAYVECLQTAVRAADEAVNEASRNAIANIENRTDLAPAQRTRWKNMIEEAQVLFVRFRNFECQNVAPYESKPRIGSFEERLTCLIDKNTARARELQRRYGDQ